MQSGYGGVSEIQQFMVDSCGSSLFSISPANAAATAANPADIRSASPHPLKYHQLPHPHHYHPQPPPAAALPPHFSHFHSIPITQQLFHRPAHQFQLFHPHQQQYMPPEQRRQLIPQHHHLGLDQESAPENSASPARIIPGSSGPPSFLAPAVSFKLAVNESSGGGSREGINDDDGILQGDDGSESRLHRWQREEESSAIKELSWRPLDIDYINRNNKRCKEKEPESSNAKYSKKNKEVAESDNVPVEGGNNYKIFSELEAIYKPGGGGGGNATCGAPNQTGSGSALTGDETHLLHAAAMAAPGVPAAVGGSETSAGEEATAKKSSKGGGRRRRKRRQRQLRAVAAFFESLVKQLMDHQESLHRKFLEVMESREQERASREEAWRKQEAAKSSHEAAARAQERALASSREAAIISFIEKITGESLNLPSKSQVPDIVDANKERENTTNTHQVEPYSETFNNGGDPDSSKGAAFNTSRWPKAEVHALIRVRSGFETRFQEPGLKGPLWEEVSATMVAMGYRRSAKRCKEKWENINKYFRKTKEKGKKRPQHSKTCPYFQQLDQLYSKSLNSTKPNPSSSSPATANPSAAGGDQPKDISELLDAIVVPLPAAEHQTFKVSDMGALRFDFNSKLGDDTGDGAAGAAARGVAPPREKDQDHQRGRGEEDEGVEEEDDDDDNDDEDEEEEEEEEAQGESQGAGRHETLHEEEDDDLHNSSLFFDRLQS